MELIWTLRKSIREESIILWVCLRFKIRLIGWHEARNTLKKKIPLIYLKNLNKKETNSQNREAGLLRRRRFIKNSFRKIHPRKKQI